jgi:hypothetical protein
MEDKMQVRMYKFYVYNKITKTKTKPLFFTSEQEAKQALVEYVDARCCSLNEVELRDNTTNKLFEWKIFAGDAHVETARILKTYITIH